MATDPAGSASTVRAIHATRAARAEAPSRGSLFTEMLDWMLAPFLLVWPLSVGLTYLIGISLANDAFDRSLASKTRALATNTAGTVGGRARSWRGDWSKRVRLS